MIQFGGGGGRIIKTDEEICRKINCFPEYEMIQFGEWGWKDNQNR